MRALVLTADGYEDCELFVPYYRLKEEGAQIDVAAPRQGGKIIGRRGHRITADHAFPHINAGAYDLLLVPGGQSPSEIRIDPYALGVVRQVLLAGKPIAAISSGAQVLISARAVDGRNLTCCPTIRHDLARAGATYLDRAVAVDDNLITSRGPDDLPAFCRAMIATLRGADRPKQPMKPTAWREVNASRNRREPVHAVR